MVEARDGRAAGTLAAAGPFSNDALVGRITPVVVVGTTEVLGFAGAVTLLVATLVCACEGATNTLGRATSEGRRVGRAGVGEGTRVSWLEGVPEREVAELPGGETRLAGASEARRGACGFFTTRKAATDCCPGTSGTVVALISIGRAVADD